MELRPFLGRSIIHFCTPCGVFKIHLSGSLKILVLVLDFRIDLKAFVIAVPRRIAGKIIEMVETQSVSYDSGTTHGSGQKRP